MKPTPLDTFLLRRVSDAADRRPCIHRPTNPQRVAGPSTNGGATRPPR